MGKKAEPVNLWKRWEFSQTITSIILVVFLFGVAVGFTLHYIFYALFLQPPTPTPKAPLHAATTPPPSPSETTTTQTSAADLDGLWPARHLIVGVRGTMPDIQTLEMLAEYKPTGVLLRQENLENEEQTRRLIRAVKGAVGFGIGLEDPPLIFIAADKPLLASLIHEEWLEPRRLAEQGTLAIRKAARELAHSLRRMGFSGCLAPPLDLPGTEDVVPAVLTQTWADTAVLVAERGGAFIQGLRDGGILPMARFFPGLLGATVTTTAPLPELAEHNLAKLAEYFFPFQKAAQQGAEAIWVAHVRVPALHTAPPDAANPTPDVPASLSPKILTLLIRRQWQYEGVLIADDVTAPMLNAAFSPEEAAVKALAAGCDAVLVLDATPERVNAVCRSVLTAVAQNVLTPEQLDKKKERLDAWEKTLREMAALGPAFEVPQDKPEEEEAPPAPAEQPEAQEQLAENQSPPAIETTAKADSEPTPEPTPPAPPTDVAPPTGEGNTTEPAQEAAAPSPDNVAPTTADTLETSAEPQPAHQAQETKDAEPTAETASEPASTPPASQPDITPKKNTPSEGESPTFEKYVVQPGDTLFRISVRFGVSVDSLVRVNGLKDPTRVNAGTTLKIPKR